MSSATSSVGAGPSGMSISGFSMVSPPGVRGPDSAWVPNRDFVRPTHWPAGSCEPGWHAAGRTISLRSALADRGEVPLVLTGVDLTRAIDLGGRILEIGRAHV